MTQVNENRASQSEMKGRPNRSEVRPRSVWAACMATPVAKLGGIVGEPMPSALSQINGAADIFRHMEPMRHKGFNFAAPPAGRRAAL